MRRIVFSNSPNMTSIVAVPVNAPAHLPKSDISISAFSWSQKIAQPSAMGKKHFDVDDPTYPKLRTAQESRSAFAFDKMDDALDAFARGEFLVVMDDENRENEGDLIVSASKCTTEKMAWMIKHTRCAFYSDFLTTSTHPILSGYICISLSEERVAGLNIPMMVPDNQDRHRTAYTVTLDCKEGMPSRTIS